jgi:hypothetical protein
MKLEDTAVGVAPDCPTISALAPQPERARSEQAWGDETPTAPTQPRPIPYALTGLLGTVMLSAIGLASYMLVTGHAPQPPPIAAPPTTTTVVPLPKPPPGDIHDGLPPLPVTITPPPVTVTAPAPTPVVVPPPTPVQSQQDREYLRMLAADWKRDGWDIDDPAKAIENAHHICRDMAGPSHPTRLQMAHAIHFDDNPPYALVYDMVLDANTVYCPQLD